MISPPTLTAHPNRQKPPEFPGSTLDAPRTDAGIGAFVRSTGGWAKRAAKGVHMKPINSCSATLLVAAIAHTSFGQTAEYIPLPRGFLARSVSSDGRVVVGIKTAPFSQGHYWSEETGLVPLLGPQGETMTSTAWATNADGTVITGAMINGTQTPYRWTASTGIVPLANARFYGAPTGYAVSDDGSVIVGTGSLVQNNAGFVWREGFGVADLLGPANSFIMCLSEDKRFAVGFAGVVPSTAQILRWDLETGAHESLILHDNSGNVLRGQARDVSADGSIIVGGSSDFEPGNGTMPFMWTTQGQQTIGNVTGEAIGVSADGLVVVGHTSTIRRAWIYTEGLGVLDLKQFLRDYHNLNLPSSVTLGSVYGISADGRTILGSSWIVKLGPALLSDFNRNEYVDFTDLLDFLDCFEGRHILPVSSADINHDGITDLFDLLDFMDNF